MNALFAEKKMYMQKNFVQNVGKDLIGIISNER